MNKKRSLSNALKQQDIEEHVVRLESKEKRTNENEKSSKRSGYVNISGWFPRELKFELEEVRLERSRKLGRRVTLQELQNEIYYCGFTYLGIDKWLRWRKKSQS